MTREPPRREPQAFGWDIGGAHVKVALWSDAGLVDVAQWPCTLWRGIDHLHRVIEAAAQRWPALSAPGALHGVTMTGEMADGFEDRRRGVLAILDALGGALPDARILAYAGTRGFIERGRVGEDTDAWAAVASANWLATAAHAAAWLASRPQAHPDAATEAGTKVLPAGWSDGVLLDIGSTTTDIVALRGGLPCTDSRSDADRLASGELLYLGIVRTPLCALTQQLHFAGQATGVMNEWFATTADVYRLIDELQPEHDQHETADGGAKTPAGSRRRIARMIGRDAGEASDEDWRGLALQWRAAQVQATARELARVRARHGIAADAPVIACGCGAFLVADVLQAEARLGRPDDPPDRSALNAVASQAAAGDAHPAPILDWGRDLIRLAPSAAASADLRTWSRVAAPSVAVAAACLAASRATAPATLSQPSCARPADMAPARD